MSAVGASMEKLLAPHLRKRAIYKSEADYKIAASSFLIDILLTKCSDFGVSALFPALMILIVSKLTYQLLA